MLKSLGGSSIDSVIKICHALGITVEQLEGIQDENSQEKITAQDIKNSSSSNLDAELVEIYKLLGAEGKTKLLEQARLLREAGK